MAIYALPLAVPKSDVPSQDAVYRQHGESCVRRVLSFLDQDPASPSYGCFDRAFWGWKKKDFPDTTLQYAIIPLLKSGGVSDAVILLGISFDFFKKYVHRNGTCDQSYPYENHPKTFLDLVPVLHQIIASSEGTFSSEMVIEAKTLIRKGLESSLKPERYAFIANHVAHDMYQYLSSATLLGDSRFYDVASSHLKSLKENTHPEGWHMEYCGADPGYQTRALKYLTRCLPLFQDREREACLALCRASCEFLRKAVMPDGCLYAMFGSRNTALVYPSGIEAMAAREERFQPLAARVRWAITEERAILPEYLEFDNFIRLFDDYCDAAAIAEKGHLAAIGEDAEDEEFYLPGCGLCRMRRSGVNVYFHARFGGAIAVYRGKEPLAYDAGLLVEDGRGRFYGSRNLTNPSRLISREADAMTIETELFRAIHRNLSPGKLIMLRLLNLSFLRFQWLSDLFRSALVKLMILGRAQRSRGRVRRRIALQGHALVLTDELSLRFTARRVRRLALLNLFHTASSRYPTISTETSAREEITTPPKDFTMRREITLLG